MGLGFLNVAKAIFNGKKEEVTQAMIEANPEMVLDQAIKEAKEKMVKEEEKVAELRVIRNKIAQQIAEKEANLRKIKEMIVKAQREGATADAEYGRQLFKTRENELDEDDLQLKEIDEAINEVITYLNQQQREIDNFEVEKASLMSKLAAAKTKEEIMNIKAGIGKTTSATSNFNAAKQAIGKKVDKVNARQEVKTSLGNTPGGRFSGL